MAMDQYSRIMGSFLPGPCYSPFQILGKLQPMVISVYGLGRFGQFWAEQLIAWGLPRGHKFLGFSRSETRAIPEGMVRIEEAGLIESDVIILCTAISSLDEVLPRIAPFIRPETLVMDTCSVKVAPTEAMKKYLPESVELMGTHPMFGPDSGKNGIAGLPLVFSPVRCKEKTTQAWDSYFNEMKLEVITMTPEEHDREAAYTQGVTHFIGRVLNEMELKSSPIATLGYRELMKIVEQTCNDPFQLFLDLQNYNPYTHQMRLELQKALEDNLELMDQ